VILALREGSSLPQHLPCCCTGTPAELGPSRELTGHFDEATEPVSANHSQVTLDEQVGA